MSKRNKRKKGGNGAFGCAKCQRVIPVDWATAEQEIRELAKQHGFNMTPIVPLADYVYLQDKRN